MVGSTDVLATVLTASVESGIAVRIHPSWLIMQWCHAELMQLKLVTPMYDHWLCRHTHSKSSKTGTVGFARSSLSEPFSGLVRSAVCGFSNEVLI